MAKVSATSSLGMKVSIAHKKAFEKYDNASPHHSVTLERNVDESLTDEEMIEIADRLHKTAQDMVEKKINEDLKEIQKVD